MRFSFCLFYLKYIELKPYEMIPRVQNIHILHKLCAFKGCVGIVFMHSFQPGGQMGGWKGSGKTTILFGLYLKTVKCKKLILGRDIGC